MKRTSHLVARLGLAWTLAFQPARAFAQPPASSSGSASSATRAYSLEAAISSALANHPRVASYRADEAVAAARVDEARTSALPSAGLSAELNRSTGNTVPGAFFPTQGFVPIAGAPQGKKVTGGDWQSGISAWGNWDVLSLSREAAALDIALAGRREAEAATRAQLLEVAYRTADAFLLLVEAGEAVRAANASLGRARVLVTVTQPLVDQNLRPGVDLARARAELANAQTLLARAEQSREVRRAQLAEAMGLVGAHVDAEPGGLLGALADVGAHAPSDASRHPDVLRAAAAADRLAQAQRLVEVEYLPRLDLVAALWLRGSGSYGSPAAGVVPDVPNWAAGAVVTWSILDIPTLRARARATDASYEAARSRRDEALLAVSGQLASAAAVLDGAMKVARQTPATLSAAQGAEQQAAARYEAGLAALVDVADAQRVLAQAELDDAVARLEVRRALLLLARASGNLEPFLAQMRGGS